MTTEKAESGPSIENGKLIISKPKWFCESPRSRTIFSLGLLAISVWLIAGAFRWEIGELGSEAQGTLACFGLFFLILGLCVPSRKFHYLDLQQRKIVKEKWYSFFKLSRHETSFTHFSKIVVHHVCHPGG